MKILVTGADGFLGSHLCPQLEADGHDVLKLDRKRSQDHDLLEPRGWAHHLEGVELVYHLAALADVKSGKERPTTFLEQNVIATQFLLEVMRSKGVKRIVFTSSAAVYGDLPQIPMPEDGPMPVQTSLYGASKLAAEGLLTAYAHTFGFQVGIVRLVQLLGPGYRHGHLWDVYQRLQQNPLRLDMQSDGLSRRQYIHVLDAVAVLRWMAINICEVINCPSVWIQNAATGLTWSIRESTRLACGTLNLNPETTWADEPGWAGDPACIEVLSSPLQPERHHSIADAIRETVLSFQQVPA